MNIDIIKIIRPHQWIKNLFVFIPMFFGGSFTDCSDIIAAAITFVAFSFIASSIYCLNDIIDVDADRKHPTKCHRPIAAGKVSVRQAYGLMTVLFLLSMSTLLLLSHDFSQVAITLLFYFVLNVAYCVKLKQYAIVDVCVIAFGFVLRIMAGGQATEVTLSKWIVLMSFLLTLFLAFTKRRDDVLKMNETGHAPRRNTSRYNLTFINQAITITGSVMVVCYIMYTISPEVTAHFHSDNLYLTSILVILGLLRYIQITVVDEQSGDPTKVILHDHATQLILLAWGISFLVIIYL